MRRRQFIAALGSAAAWPLAARAQQRPVPVVGYLGSTSLQIGRPQTAAFLKGLAETGFVEGRNVTIEYRWADDDYGRLPDLAANLVRRRVDVIASPNVTAAALAAKAATQDIPIVFLTGADPIQIGLVTSLSRPGGNLTGVAILNGELAPKRLELLQKIVPGAKLIAYMGNPTNPGFAGGELTAVKTAADILGLRVLTLSVSTENEIETAFENMVRQSADALLIGGDAFFSLRRDRIVDLALRNRIPTIYDRSLAAAAGGLISYGTDTMEPIRQVGVYTGRILKGEKPADLPVQQVTKLDLVINLKTAKALGLTIPETLLATADEVIQ
jgi:putative tryptophan/tyrosine transport system substrate-binding protein